MSLVNICFKDTDFEHDVYELIRAFYPGESFVSVYPDREEKALPEVPRLTFEVKRREGEYLITASEGEGQPGHVARAALLSFPPGKGEDGTEELDAGQMRTLRKANKDRIKHALYGMLVQMTGKTLPWGNLTGIRPAKLASGFLKEGIRGEEAVRELRERYLVSQEKASLAVSIAETEEKLLSGFDLEKGYSLYIGIPFCPSICLYCSFSSSPLGLWEKRVDEYLDALCLEMTEVSAMLGSRGKLESVYIGGGTPTSLNGPQLTRLLSHLSACFDLSNLREFTVEAGRPDSIDREKLLALRAFPVDRISVNPQTMNQKTLDLIGRRHTVEDTGRAFALAQEVGFTNINMDIIVGLPGEGREEVAHTLAEIEKLSPDSLTVHTLAVKRAARLSLFKEEYLEMSSEDNEEVIRLAGEAAGRMGMIPYYLYRQKNMRGNFENVGYAKVDKAGIYNILIMEEKQSIIALGAGGATRLVLDGGERVERIENVKDVRNYLSRVEEMVERKREALCALF